MSASFACSEEKQNKTNTFLPILPGGLASIARIFSSVALGSSGSSHGFNNLADLNAGVVASFDFSVAVVPESSAFMAVCFLVTPVGLGKVAPVLSRKIRGSRLTPGVDAKS